MFDILQATHPTTRRSTVADLALSLGIHAAVITAALTAAPAAADAVRRVVDTRDLIFVPRPAALEPAKAPEAPRARELPSNLIVNVNPPPKGFQTIGAPTSMPTSIPPIDLNARALDPRNFSGRGVEGGVANGVVGGTGKITDEDLGGGLGVGEAVYTELQLDDIAQVVSQPPLQYPTVLESAGVTGSVVVQFIIDTTGRVEKPSIKVLSSSHELFTRSAVTVIEGSTFKPARFHGQKVRQMAQQRLRFALLGS